MEKQEIYSIELNSVLTYITDKLIKDCPTTKIGVEYLIVSILENEMSNAYKILNSYFSSFIINRIHKEYYKLIEDKALIAIKPNRKIEFNNDLKKIITKAEKEREKLNSDNLSSEHIMLTLLSEETPTSAIKEFFNSLGLTYEIFLNKTISFKSLTTSTKNKVIKNTINNTTNLLDNNLKYLNEFCIDMANNFNNKTVKNIIGRKKEINDIINVLGKLNKNNVILIGEKGVGKTHICEGLIHYIKKYDLPKWIKNKKIVTLDFLSFLSGSQIRGTIEDRIKEIITTLKHNNECILFIDNIDYYLDEKNKNDDSIMSLILNIINDGTIQIIATASIDGYNNIISNSIIYNKFEKIIINPPSNDDTIKILTSIKPYYENYHKITYDNETLNLCVYLANKYITDKKLPESAIDLLDQSGSMAKNKNLAIVNNDIVYNTISDITNIPLQKLNKTEKEVLRNIDKKLKRYVIGQDDAIKRICNVIKRNRVGLSNHNKTMGNIFMLGTSGCGKTLLAKKIAEEIFGDESYLVRFDMSEYSDKTSINKLIGSSPGYVGYENGGQLTEIIKTKKYCVLLFDEIEKSDTQIFNLFLQLFDEGCLTDNMGNKIDFKNVIVLMTSNVGTREANDMGNEIGFISDIQKNKNKIIEKELKRKFPPEFINRLDDIIYFNSLNDNDLKKIIQLELSKLDKKLSRLNYYITYDNNIVNLIFDKIKKDKEYGARPIIRVIQDEIENKLTDLLLLNDYEIKHTFKIKIGNNNELLIY